MFRYLLLALLFIGLYRFITRFVLPVMKVTTTVRRQMRQMQDGGASGTTAPPESSPKKKGDYIEFEELR